MPGNFPEAWVDRVIQHLDTADQVTFLEGIPEINADVHQINGGTSTEKNIIYVPTTDFEVEILVNNNSYPIPFQEYDDDTVMLHLDKYQTKVITLKDDDTLGASYDKIDVVTRGSIKSINGGKYKRAIHSIAPLENTPDTPVIVATGGTEKLVDENGRPRLTYVDLVTAKEKTKGFGDRKLVLNETHWNDLLLDRKNFGDQLVNYKTGEVAPMIASFEIHKYESDMPIYGADLKKKPFGSIQEDKDKVASVIFVNEAVGKKTGITTQYFLKAADNPSRQSNDLSYRHYFIVSPFQNKKIGAII